MAGAGASGCASILAIATLRPVFAAAGRAHACARSIDIRTHSSRSRHGSVAISRRMSRAPIAFVRRDARAGVEWLRRAYVMFRSAPLRWLLLLFTYYLLVSLSEFGPWRAVGQFVAPILKPVFAVGFLAAAWTQERGTPPKLVYLFRGFRSNLFALVPLGIVFLVGMAFAVLATTLVDDG